MAELLTASELFYTAFEPKTKNRFVLYCDGIPTYLVYGCTRPSYKQDAKTLDHINTRRFYKGKTIWEPVNLKLYDPIVPSGAHAVMEWQRLHHESVTGRDGYMDFYKKDLVINVLGPVGDKVEEWLMKGCQITTSKFGELDYTDDGNAILIEFTVQPDYCILKY